MYEHWSWPELAATDLGVTSERARDVALTGIEQVLSTPRTSHEEHAIFRSIDDLFRAEFGPLSEGWTYRHKDGGWSTRGLSTLRRQGEWDHKRVAAVADTASAGLNHWWTFLAEIRTSIWSAPPPTNARVAYSVVARLTDLIIENYSSRDAWYQFANSIVGWYLERYGVKGGRYVAEAAISGVFLSWTVPDEAAVRLVSENLARKAGPHIGEHEHGVDALALHLEHEYTWLDEPEDIAARHRALAPLPPAFDLLGPHQAAIEALDARRGQVRAKQMLRALEIVAIHAAGRAPLDLELLSSAHARAMGEAGPSPIRSGVAFAKAGAERYRRLSEDPHQLPIYELGLSPCTECARLYLDVCFYHPYTDGNARAARLALAWLDLRHRIGFADLIPSFRIARVAGDKPSYWGLVRGLFSAAEAARVS